MTEQRFQLRLPVALKGEATGIADRQHKSLNQFIVDLIRREVEDDIGVIILGWVKLDRWGELDRDEVCDECGQDLDMADGVYIGLMSDNSIHGPVCTGCATNE